MLLWGMTYLEGNDDQEMVNGVRSQNTAREVKTRRAKSKHGARSQYTVGPSFGRDGAIHGKELYELLECYAMQQDFLRSAVQTRV